MSASTASRCGVVEVGEAGGEPVELGGANLLGGPVHRCDQRRRLAGRRLDEEALDLLGDDDADAFGLGGTLRQATVGPVAQVVEVGQRDAVEVGHRRVDVARHGDVDDEQRAVRGPPGACVGHQSSA